MLPAHLVVDLVGIVRNVTNLLDVRGDGAVKSRLVVRHAEHVFLVDDQLGSAFLPLLLCSAGSRPDPCSPVETFEPHHHRGQGLPLPILQIIQRDTITVLGHLMTAVKRVLHLMANLWELVRCSQPAVVADDGGSREREGWRHPKY